MLQYGELMVNSYEFVYDFILFCTVCCQVYGWTSIYLYIQIFALATQSNNESRLLISLLSHCKMKVYVQCIVGYSIPHSKLCTAYFVRCIKSAGLAIISHKSCVLKLYCSKQVMQMKPRAD